MDNAENTSITRLLSDLREVSGGWQTADYWVDDLCAIGLTSEARPQHLVYVNTSGLVRGRFYVELEVGSTKGYVGGQVVATHESLTFSELIALVRVHLGLLH